MPVRKNLFYTTLLSAAMSLGKPAAAQQQSDRYFPFNFGPGIMMPGGGSFSGGSGGGVPMTFPSPKKPAVEKSRIGFLYVRGPEGDSSRKKAEAQREPGLFKKHFNDNIVKTVGNGVDSVGIDEILNAFDELAEEDIDVIVFVNLMHGSPAAKLEKIQGCIPDKGLAFMSDNQLQYKSDGSGFSSDSLYKAVGDRFKTNKKLRDKRLILLHQPCHAEAAFNAFHYLPPATTVYYFASGFEGNWYEPGDNSFAVAFDKIKQRATAEKRPAPVLDDKAVLVAACFSSNTTLGRRMDRNKMRFLIVLDEAPDTARVEDKKFYFGTHKAAVLKPSDIARQITEKFTDEQIQKDLAEYDDIVPPDQRQKALNMFRMNIYTDWTGRSDVETVDCINFISLAMALKHDGFFRNSLHYGTSNDVRAAGYWKFSPIVKPAVSQ